MAQTKPKFSQAQVIAVLHETHGMVYLAAERLGTTHQTLYNYLKRYPMIRAVKEAENGKLLDIGEQKLYQKVLDGEAWAIQFLLKTKGKDRGYVERQEGLVTVDANVQVHVVSAKMRITKRLDHLATQRNGHSTPTP